MKLFAFGLGYSALFFISRHGGSFEAVAGTARTPEKARELAGAGVETFVFGPEGDDPAIAPALAAADVVLVSIPPGVSVDPVLARFGHKIAGLRRRQTIIYLSTIGVYGDRGGEWVVETAPPAPASARSKARLQAEKSWAAIGRDKVKTTHILRLAGIYGPGRNALHNLRAGSARRVVKPDQVFNRIHVEDIGRAIAAVARIEAGGVCNVADDAPAPPQDVVSYAAMLMGIEPPPEQDLASADLSPLARSFYAENKRVSNQKLKQILGGELTYPTYRVGLQALWEAGEGREDVCSALGPAEELPPN